MSHILCIDAHYLLGNEVKGLEMNSVHASYVFFEVESLKNSCFGFIYGILIF